VAAHDRTDEDGLTTPQVFTELSARPLGPVRRFLRRRPVVVDLLVAAGFTGWALLLGVGADSMYALHARFGGDRVLQMQLASLGLTVVGAIALLVRRRRPVPVAVAMALLGVGALAVTGATSGFEVGTAVALFTVATRRDPAVTWGVLAGTVTSLLLAAWLLPLPPVVGALMAGLDPDGAGRDLRGTVWFQTAAPVVVLALLAVATGASVRNRRLHLAAFVEQANAVAREQEQRVQLARASERARIAREMHDVVAHSVSVMVTLGGGAAAALDQAPDRSRAALGELVATGQGALRDMRRVLDVLHEDEPGGTAGPGAPLAPQPGTGDLRALTDRFRTAGLALHATGLDDRGLATLPAALQLTVFRIAQEALTNVLRHAPGTAGAALAVRRTAGSVELVVTDQGDARGTPGGAGAGRGVLGMRERAAAFGGTVETGPHGTGWRVRAVLPHAEGNA
jgi:signal transduction histidine kinase